MVQCIILSFMKRLFILILTSLALCYACAQSTIVFNKIENYVGTSSNAHHGESIIKLENNYYFTTLFAHTVNQGLVVVKLDDYANEINRRVFLDSNYRIFSYPFTATIATSDSCIMVCANITLDSNGHTLGYLIKLNQNLDTLWTKLYSHPDTLVATLTDTIAWNTLTAVNETSDGGFIVTGNSPHHENEINFSC